MIPGPTNVNPIVLAAMTRRTLSYVSQGFANILADLQRIFGIPHAASAGTGTLGAEVALTNVIDNFEVPWGPLADPNEAERRLSSADYKSLSVVHVDISTGDLGPLSQKVIRVGHMGNVNRNDLLTSISAAESSLWSGCGRHEPPAPSTVCFSVLSD